MAKNKRILVAPLDWGLGHASRCVPIIKQLLKEGQQPILAADNSPLIFLRKEFPELQFVKLNGTAIKYHKNIPLWLSMALQLHKVLIGIKKERNAIKKIITKHNIDGVISDNRYGLSTKIVPTVFIGHQLSVRASLLTSLLKYVSNKYVAKFNFCWIPDFQGEQNLSGKLSHGNIALKNKRYIGPLSRFSRQTENTNPKRDLIVILSGVEPARSVFENKLVTQLESLTSVNTLVVRGVFNDCKIASNNSNIKFVQHLNSTELESEINNSELVICRAAYSSVMDMVALDKNAILIPTKGQTEQEYLAKRLMQNRWFFSQKEKNFDLKTAINKSKNYKRPVISEQVKLKEAISEFLKSC